MAHGVHPERGEPVIGGEAMRKATGITFAVEREREVRASLAGIGAALELLGDTGERARAIRELEERAASLHRAASGLAHYERIMTERGVRR